MDKEIILEVYDNYQYFLKQEGYDDEVCDDWIHVMNMWTFIGDYGKHVYHNNWIQIIDLYKVEIHCADYNHIIYYDKINPISIWNMVVGFMKFLKNNNG